MQEQGHRNTATPQHRNTATPQHRNTACYYLLFLVLALFQNNAFTQAVPCNCFHGTAIGTINGGIVKLSDWKLAAGITGNSLSSICINLNATLDVDIDFEFNDVYFVAQPGVYIQVKSGITLTLTNGTSIVGCNDGIVTPFRWGGIFALENSRINIFNSLISDADVAINGTACFLDIRGSTFNRNAVSVQVKDPQNTGGGTLFIVGTRFTCDAPLFPGSTFPGMTLSHTAVEVFGYYRPVIGTLRKGAITSATANHITGHDIGVSLSDCFSAVVRGLSLNNIYDRNGDGQATGVFLFNMNDSQTFLEQVWINDSESGVLAQGSPFRIESCIFNTRATALDIRNGRYTQVAEVLTSQLSSETGHAISLSGGFTSSPFRRLFISHNRLIGDPAIFIGVDQGVEVSNNVIIGGANTSNLSSPGLWYNNQFRNAIAGLNLYNTRSQNFVENDFQDLVVGLQLLFSPSNYFCCNAMNNTEQFGMSFLNDCFDTQLWNTSFRTGSIHPLHVVEAAQMSEQMNRGNDFSMENSILGDAFYSGTNPNLLPSNRFQSETARYPNSIVVSPPLMPTDWYTRQGIDPDCSANPAYGPWCNQVIWPILGDGDDLSYRFSEPSATDYYTLVEKQILNQRDETEQAGREEYLFQKLRNNPALLGASESLNTFYLTHQNTAVGELFKLDVDLQSLSKVPDSYKVSLESIASSLGQLDKTLEQLLFQLETNPNDQILKTQIFDLLMQAKELVEAQTQIWQEIDGIQLMAAQGVLAEAQLIHPTRLFQENQKIVQSIILEVYTSEPRAYSDHQIEELSLVAKQCPIEGGRWVYVARSILNWLVQTSEMENWCEDYPWDFVEDRVQEGQLPNVAVPLTLSPNPAETGSILQVLPQDIDAQIERITAINLLGQAVDLVQLEDHNFSILGLEPGLYLLNCQLKDGAIHTQKLYIYAK